MAELSTVSIDTLLDDLRQLCALPGSPAQTAALTTVAGRVAALMRRHGLQTELLATAGAPVVVGRRAGRSPFTLLLYHHYDVASPGPWRVWNHEPFQLAEREDVLYGRGVADGKGPLAAHLAALDALMSAEGELPCGVVVLAEGEALAGSPNLGQVVVDRHQWLKADACLATGGERDAAGLPLAYGGVKGLLQLQLTAVGANQPLPSGMAASVPNPLWRLLWALSQIKSEQEEILIGGFYDDVEGPSREENQLIRSVTIDEAGRMAAWGLNEFLFGMSGASLVRTEATLPTCNVSSLNVAPGGEFAVLPMVATARLDFQLVPRQRPHTVTELLKAHLIDKDLQDVVVERLPGGYPAVHTAIDHPFFQHVRQAGQQLYGADPNWMPFGPFAMPLFFLTEAFDIPAVVMGCARPDSAANGPNEHLPIGDLLRHGQLLIELMHIAAR